MVVCKEKLSPSLPIRTKWMSIFIYYSINGEMAVTFHFDFSRPIRSKVVMMMKYIWPIKVQGDRLDWSDSFGGVLIPFLRGIVIGEGETGSPSLEIQMNIDRYDSLVDISPFTWWDSIYLHFFLLLMIIIIISKV